MQEWNQLMTQVNNTAVCGGNTKAPPREKPAMFAFCLKLHGMEIEINIGGWANVPAFSLQFFSGCRLIAKDFGCGLALVKHGRPVSYERVAASLGDCKRKMIDAFAYQKLSAYLHDSPDAFTPLRCSASAGPIGFGADLAMLWMNWYQPNVSALFLDKVIDELVEAKENCSGSLSSSKLKYHTTR
ncbi:hypothetical protein POM88_036225 [Heracleum sosnowskyi]|uniref:Uncharacterized protein n=1 Tax=Heracleum sosnowskyi TaxID=360622 RepID=A0AAD8HNU2_9APIA|nr:hypothetical protein POM88_036225 [Heracleum sosnowskyi]